MQNVSVTMGIVLGILTVAIWLGGAVWFLSDLHNQWQANTNSVEAIKQELTEIDGRLQEIADSNKWLKTALCEHDLKNGKYRISKCNKKVL